MRVADLADVVDRVPTRFVSSRIGDMKLEGRVLHLPEHDFEMDEDELAAFGKYFKIPAGFLGQLPLELIQANLDYFMVKHADDRAVIEVDGGSLSQMFGASAGIVPHASFAEVVSNTMKPDDEIVRCQLSGGRFEVDVVTEEHVVEARVGDLTKAGLRFKAHVSPKERQPQVSSYMQRLVCTNGQVSTEEDGLVEIKGMTIDDIIAEMELAAIRVLSGLDQRLDQWKALTEVSVENVERMIHRLSVENGISANVESRIMERAPAIEGDSLYDVVNLMTAMQHADGMASQQIERLMVMGGNVVATGGNHRCPSCDHSLAA